MESAFSWIGSIIQWFGLFIPRRVIVRKTDKLIKFTYSGDVVEKGPGIRWFWPFTTEIIQLSVVRQPLDIKTTRFTTADGRACIADCTVVYVISDAVKFLTENFDGHLALSECVNACLKNKLSEMTFKEIQESNTLNEELTDIISTDTEDFGVDIEYVRLQDFTWVIPISLIGNDSTKFIAGSI
jgi:regulator of protease activity HflC (stomatin/prohibitin superfamily)